MQNRLFLMLIIVAMGSVLAHADAFSGKVTAVIQPDLLTIDRAGAPYEVRVYGADAPEAGQAFAEESLAFVKSKALGQDVTVEGVATDSNGKIVGVVKLADGTDLAAVLISNGLAWWDEKNAPEAKALQGANAKALVGKSGLFKDPAQLAPWDFRKSHGGDAYAYSVKPAEDKPAAKAPVELKLKGNMTEGGVAASSAPAGDAAPASGAPTSIAGFEVPKEVAPLLAKHKPRIATDASGKPMGLTADKISEIPFAGALGFQDGDVFTGVNGMQIRSEMDVLGAVTKLKGAKNFTVSVNRGGTNVDIPVQVP